MNTHKIWSEHAVKTFDKEIGFIKFYLTEIYQKYFPPIFDLGDDLVHFTTLMSKGVKNDLDVLLKIDWNQFDIFNDKIWKIKKATNDQIALVHNRVFDLHKKIHKFWKELDITWTFANSLSFGGYTKTRIAKNEYTVLHNVYKISINIQKIKDIVFTWDKRLLIMLNKFYRWVFDNKLVL